MRTTIKYTFLTLLFFTPNHLSEGTREMENSKLLELGTTSTHTQLSKIINKLVSKIN